MKREFFAVDYGQGGIWLVIRAESADEMKERYPELDVFDEPPRFLTSGVVERTRAKRSYDLDDEPTGYLADIIGDHLP